jgi:acetolactate synthase-1/2/3 large subunit
MGHPSAARRLGEAGAVLLVGTSLPQVARAGLDGLLRSKPVISVHFEPSFVDDAPLELIGAIGPILRELGQGVTARSQARARPPREYLPEAFLPGAERRAMSFRQALATLAPHLPAGANLFVDAGNTGASAVHFLDTPRGGRHVVALGMGGMGYTFGAGIGAAFANGRRTYVLAGDGSFFMHGLEIHTAVQHALPVTFVVFNNDAHAMCHARERLYYGDRYDYNRFRPSDLAGGVAAMYPTLRVHHARHALALGDGLRDERGRSGPSFFCVDVDPAEVPPFSPFLEALPKALETRGRHEDRSRKAG